MGEVAAGHNILLLFSMNAGRLASLYLLHGGRRAHTCFTLTWTHTHTHTHKQTHILRGSACLLECINAVINGHRQAAKNIKANKRQTHTQREHAWTHRHIIVLALSSGHTTFVNSLQKP